MADVCVVKSESIREEMNSSNLKDPLSSPNDEKMEEFETLIVTASPSVDSLSSSVLYALKLDEDFPLDARDLIVRVDNPEKHSSAMESYITFRIITKTTRTDYDSHEYCVRRRYNDFMWLRQKLEEAYPTHLVPPLPEKHSMQRLSRFNPNFIKVRMIALNKFLCRVADHPVLSFDKSLQIFLTSKPFEFASHRKQGPGFIGRMSDSFHNLAATYMIKNRTQEFEAINNYIYKINEKLSSMERISQRINKEQIELNEFHPVFTLWASSENKLNMALASLASVVEKCGKAQQGVVSEYEEKYQQPLREYVLYTEAIKEVLKRRDAIQIEYELTVEELNRRKLEKEQLLSSDQTYSFGSFLGKDPEEVKQEKQIKLDKLIEMLNTQAEENNDKAECANSDLKADMERWDITKQRDLKELFSTFATQQIQYYQKCLNAWEDAIPIIKTTDMDQDGEGTLKTSVH